MTHSTYKPSDRPEVLMRLPRDARSVLELGCYTGEFGEAVKKLLPGVWYVAIEPNSAAAAIAASKLDKVIEGVFSETFVLDEQFDMIVLNDVIEHTIDHMAILRHLRTILRPHGHLCMSIPNVRYFRNVFKLLVESDWRYEPQGILDYTHLRFFTAKSIVRALDQAGYRVDRIEGINPIRRFFVRGAFECINALFLGRISDMRYLQLYVQASPIADVRNAD